MEELCSTDILFQEIRAENEKKASEILINAEEKSKIILGEVQDRIVKAKEELDSVLQNRIEVLKKNLDSTLPLEKQRYLVSFINDSIMEGMKKYFENLDSEKKELLIEKFAQNAKAIVGNTKLMACSCGSLSKESAEKILKNVFGSSFLGVQEKKENTKDDKEDWLNYGIILWTEDKKITCRLTLKEKVDEILSQNREKLALALFGGRVVE